MGIPKFFRYISERYPLTSQLLEGNKIPEFDNLYIDFNGIIHQCSHSDNRDVGSRLSEEQIFRSILSYLDHLFGKIKPKKLFFIAVDGVAPRAKMNQQRSRRFRSAEEAGEARKIFERKGVKFPEEVFDSNCITPGTVFMAKLSEQLKYFVNKKISEDSNWQICQVILSGHDVPGEGEHKIMEYIRKSRAQPDYDPNVRHCLYGLDADLIVLGLLSHDPHFCLLREEVKFGPTKKKRDTRLESINFHLLHLALMREYLDLEFREIEPALSFGYNLERIIDDFVLIAVFVGNDFLPHLPNVHIRGDGLERLFEIYKQVLPSLDGYLNESGTINTVYLQVLLDRMRDWEQEVFQHEYDYNMRWIKGKQSGNSQPVESGDSAVEMTLSQSAIFNQVKGFVLENRSKSSSGLGGTELSMPNTFSAGERALLINLAQDFHLTLSWDEYNEEDQNLVVLRPPGAFGSHSGDQNGESDSQDETATAVAVDLALKKYDEAKILANTVEDNFGSREELRLQCKVDDWKRAYYLDKLEISYDDPDQMGPLIFCYIEGLQWVMHYYYSGVCSWGWFYRYHYAPRISDFVGVDRMTFRFDLGKPFRPFEQLMGVLPEASKGLVPSPYRPLMCDVDSPILDFYPKKFKLDMNGKKHVWEAIVRIPFIDEDRLLRAMGPKEHQLTDEEHSRNTFGTTLSFSFSPGPPKVYPSSLPGIFPALRRCQCVMEPYDLPTLDGPHPVQGLCDGVLLGAQSLAGFPSLKTIPHHASLRNHGVNIHGTESRNKSMVISVENIYEGKETQELAEEMIGQRVFIGWPFLQEGKVTAVSDHSFKYQEMEVVPGASGRVVSNPHSPQDVRLWKLKSEKIEMLYSKQRGVVTGAVGVVIHVLPLKGMKPLDTGALVKEYETQDKETEQAVQVVITSVASEDPRYLEKASLPLSEEYPVGTKVFFLAEQGYGNLAQVSAATNTALSVILTYFTQDRNENARFKALVRSQPGEKYYPFFEVAKIVGLSSKVVSKLTSRVMAMDEGRPGMINLGLSVKFEAKALKVIGYSRKAGRHWELSQSTVDLISEYKEMFPEVMKHLERNANGFLQLSEVFLGADFDSRARELKDWLDSKGIRNFEAVPLNCESVGKETVGRIEELADQLLKRPPQIKKARIESVPRQAVLKPAHAIYRLRNQRFDIGDRVVMVKDSGSVPLSTRGVVIGINVGSIDVVWDVAFMSGSTLGNRCSQCRGATVDLDSSLNLTNCQLLASVNSSEHQQLHPNAGPRHGAGQWPPPQSTWRAPVNKHPVDFVATPHRGGFGNSRGRGTPDLGQATGSSFNHWGNGPEESQIPDDPNVWNYWGRGRTRGHGPRGSGGGSNFRGRGFNGRVPPTRGGGPHGHGG